MFPKSTHFLTEIFSSIDEYILLKYNDPYACVKTQYIVGASITNDSSIIAWYNNEPYHSPPLAINLLHNALVKSRLGSGYSIDVSNSPLPYSTQSRIEMLETFTSTGFQISASITSGMAIVLAIFIATYIQVSTTLQYARKRYFSYFNRLHI